MLWRLAAQFDCLGHMLDRMTQTTLTGQPADKYSVSLVNKHLDRIRQEIDFFRKDLVDVLDSLVMAVCNLKQD